MNNGELLSSLTQSAVEFVLTGGSTYHQAFTMSYAICFAVKASLLLFLILCSSKTFQD